MTAMRPARPEGTAAGGLLRSAGALAGIGFTMSLFVSTPAFDREVESAQAKSATLAASIVAGLVGCSALRFWAPAAEKG